MKAQLIEFTDRFWSFVATGLNRYILIQIAWSERCEKSLWMRGGWTKGIGPGSDLMAECYGHGLCLSFVCHPCTRHELVWSKERCDDWCLEPLYEEDPLYERPF
ncbi:hypothetical protein BpHYR1_015936 [Brachionus plicatilis]|uniref:Uncharacterized protein n=1 Tax=Brachionus plicatilis TaxID=10195 RepID=A0A3M7S6B9_BRAPC|nr:hypothetical protein BpHYR1_015936 [Brachionus plicatilis]